LGNGRLKKKKRQKGKEPSTFQKKGVRGTTLTGGRAITHWGESRGRKGKKRKSGGDTETGGSNFVKKVTWSSRSKV